MSDTVCMPKLSRLVLVSPGTFYVRKPTYACTACGESFILEPNATLHSVMALEREHICKNEKPGCNTGSFPALKMLRDHKAKENL